MLKRRLSSAQLRLSQNLAIISGSILIVFGLLGVLWQQKTNQLVQASDDSLVSQQASAPANIKQTNTAPQAPVAAHTNTPDQANTAQSQAPLKQSTSSRATHQATQATTTQQPPAVPNCQQVAHILPQQIDLLNRPDGLTHIIEPPIYFRVYGREPKAIQQQIWRCSPPTGHRHLHAISQSRLDISYRQLQIPLSDTCKLANVKVGLRTITTLPTWQADQWTPATTRQAMERFLSGITTHEAGHAQIDLQYAEYLLSRLRQVNTPCASLISEVQLIANQVQAELRAAQQNYELKTNYGAKQGAWL